MFLRKKIGSEFFPETDEGQFSVIYKLPIGTRVEKTELVTERIEKVVAQTLAPMKFEGKDVPIYTTLAPEQVQVADDCRGRCALAQPGSAESPKQVAPPIKTAGGARK